MNTKNEKETRQDLEAMLVSADPKHNGSNALERLANRIEQRYDQEDREIAQRAAEQMRYREQQLKTIAKSMEQHILMQNACPHLKPNFTTALNGQRDHQGELHMVCSYCGREFTDAEMGSHKFSHLNKSADQVGGPIF